jgi:hypothetical protein
MIAPRFDPLIPAPATRGFDSGRLSVHRRRHG